MAEHDLQSYQDRCLLILPGTHSKHILIDNGVVTKFHTYMTGEIFDMISKHTVLAPTVDVSGDLSVEDFRDGVKLVHKIGLAAALFRVRSRSLLDRTSPAKNASFLSGILIGAETADVARFPDRPVIVVANESLLDLYHRAMPHNHHCVYLDSIDRATSAAHRLILQQIYK
jgi:2-dehydro-3-deoxygalactonokinase